MSREPAWCCNFRDGLEFVLLSCRLCKINDIKNYRKIVMATFEVLNTYKNMKTTRVSF